MKKIRWIYRLLTGRAHGLRIKLFGFCGCNAYLSNGAQIAKIVELLYGGYRIEPTLGNDDDWAQLYQGLRFVDVEAALANVAIARDRYEARMNGERA